MAIDTREYLKCSIVKSIPKKFDLVVLKIELSNNFSLSVAGCYHPPSAPAYTLMALSSALAPFSRAEFLPLSDLNWDTIKPPDKVIQQLDAVSPPLLRHL